MDVIAPAEPSDSVKARVRTLLRKLPQGEADWSSKISSAERLYEHQSRLLLSEITPETSITTIFETYANCIENFKRVEAESEVDFLKILALSTGKLLLADQESHPPPNSLHSTATHDSVCEGVRLCFRSAGSSSALDDKRLVEYMGSMSRGVELMHYLERYFTPRAHELPIHGTHDIFEVAILVLNLIVSMFSIFLCCRSRDALPYIVSQLFHGAYRPHQVWDSRIISIPHMIHCNLGKRFR